MMTAGATLALMSLLLPGPDPPGPIFAGHENRERAGRTGAVAALYRSSRRRAPLLQGLGNGCADRVSGRLGTAVRHVGYQMVPLCEQGLRCIAYDRRGHGRSSDAGRGYDYDTLADDLAAVLDSLDLRGVTLVGMSMASGEMVRYLRGTAQNGSHGLCSLPLPRPPSRHGHPIIPAASQPSGLMRGVRSFCVITPSGSKTAGSLSSFRRHLHRRRNGSER